jgi:hypothetical protein
MPRGQPPDRSRPEDALPVLRTRCDALLATLELGTPYDLKQLIERLAAQRGRPIELVADPPPGQGGVWIERADRDSIHYPQHTSRFHQALIILHEVAHMVLQHTACDVVEDVLPNLSPATVRRVLCRHARSTREEREAELLASLLLQRAAVSYQQSGLGSMTPIEAFLAGLP